MERLLGFDLSCGVEQLIIRILGVLDLNIHLNLPSLTPRQSTLQREGLLDRHIDKHIIVGLCLRMNGHLRIQLRGGVLALRSMHTSSTRVDTVAATASQQNGFILGGSG